MTVKPITKIIFLSVLLSIGILLVVLSCALFHNYHPLYVIAVFLVAPLPNAIFSNLNANYQSDFLSDSAPNGNPFKDFGEFVTGIFVFSGLVLPIILWHVQLIVFWSMIMSLSGGFIVYASIILFSMFFNMSDDDEGFDF